ncbi:GTP hydrolase involved in nickel liganding into hydrogenases [Candidatus Accumulibacter aalborgensis]|uniref:Hydrogenase maturation factor HypB n=1 Tax=Candidatus Accumulibacter aalborgensis TaxID=1860102 RepID=A0A1A8XJJ7_9PROT|nr:hydrogenase nickel incorporation protein HypB [Candidatus Accumulibacter aalborgensis]SBT05359.1 GTP hydrolase involved in nickel liganding into hydrogenases [Candidatus Accumulibacter aalborgensis]
MCTSCGCGAGEARVADEAWSERESVQPDGAAQAPPERPAERAMLGHQTTGYRAIIGGGHSHQHAGGKPHSPAHHHHDDDAHVHPHDHVHRHDDEHAPAHPAALDYGQGDAGTQAPEMTQSRMVQIERDILAKNDGYAAENRHRFEAQGILALNLVSSPGSGKTTLLCRTIEALKASVSIAVIEGDQQTSRDAQRIRATGAPAVQINTGKGCHLDAQVVGHALQRLSPADDSLLLIENVGNLVCPAAFDLGEAHKVVILSVTEGEDKPLKYPDIFHAASLMLVNKIDLLPYVTFDGDLAISYARKVNPALQVIELSATTGEGFAEWLAWLMAGCATRQERKKATMAALRRRIVELEALLSAATRG